MKKISTLITTSGFALFIICFSAAIIYSAQGDGSKQEIVPAEAISYAVPAEKTQKWESLKNVTLKDYDVCLEHCGYEQSCLDKCEAAYKYRLDNQYKMLMNKKESVPGK